MINDLEKLKELLQIHIELSEIHDINTLLEKILYSARKLVHAEAGSIYVRDEEDSNILHFRFAQNIFWETRLQTGKKPPFSSQTIPVNHQSIAGYVASTGETLNIPDVYKLPDSLSYHFDDRFDKANNYHTKSMLTFPIKSPPIMQHYQGNDVIGVLQLINAKDESGQVITFNDSDCTLLQAFALKSASAIKQAQMLRSTILSMVHVAELRDPTETGTHVKRVGAVSALIYETWAVKRGYKPKLIDKFKDALKLTAMLHDVGKVAIEDSILKKPGRLTDEEYNRMKEHTVLGAKLLLNSSLSEYNLLAAEIALNHHERWDGKGYPGHIDPKSGTFLAGYLDQNGLPKPKAEEEIPLPGRIVAVADVYDALINQRSYKQSWNEEDVLNEMRKCAGSQFDPEVIDAFFDCLDNIRKVYLNC